MNMYRCYFLDDENHIAAAEDIEANTPGQAVELALLMLQSRPRHHAIELWNGARRVYPGKPAGASH